MINHLRSLILVHAFVACLVAIVGCASSRQDSDGAIKTSYNVYEGAWFQILYPETFTPRPSLASKSADGHDSVFFRSPDGSVELYVCSPQWGRATPDIDLVEDMETLVDETTVVRGTEITRTRTITAKDGSYTRFYEEIMSADGTTRKVFGFRYSNKTAREQYASVYTRFKHSLVQYAD